MARFSLRSQKFELSENDVKRGCLDLLALKGYRPIRQPSGKYLMPDKAVLDICRKWDVPVRWATVAEPGFPDFVIPRFCMETKRPGGKLSPEQENCIFELEVNRVPTAVVDSVEELLLWLDIYEKKK